MGYNGTFGLMHLQYLQEKQVETGSGTFSRIHKKSPGQERPGLLYSSRGLLMHAVHFLLQHFAQAQHHQTRQNGHNGEDQEKHG
jgi:hypothetical protein